MTRERPILFNGAMVRAILDGRKTHTRRLMKPQPIRVGPSWHWESYVWLADKRHPMDVCEGGSLKPCPCGSPGDRLWVRETWASDDGKTAQYRADGETYNAGLPWRPSIHMPRWASRITLEVVEVRVERLQDITEEDAKAEGVECLHDDRWEDYEDPSNSYKCGHAKEAFATLWDCIYTGSESWDANPWVWDVEFKVVKP